MKETRLKSDLGLRLTYQVIENVERYRVERELSVIQLAEAAGITKQYLYVLRMPGTERVMSLDVLGRLAVALDVPTCALLAEGKRAC